MEAGCWRWFDEVVLLEKVSEYSFVRLTLLSRKMLWGPSLVVQRDIMSRKKLLSRFRPLSESLIVVGLSKVSQLTLSPTAQISIRLIQNHLGSL